MLGGNIQLLVHIEVQRIINFPWRLCVDREKNTNEQRHTADTFCEGRIEVDASRIIATGNGFMSVRATRRSSL